MTTYTKPWHHRKTKSKAACLKPNGWHVLNSLVLGAVVLVVIWSVDANGIEWRKDLWKTLAPLAYTWVKDVLTNFTKRALGDLGAGD